MSRVTRRRALAAGTLLTIAAMCTRSVGADQMPLLGEPVVLNDNGAWSWFEDERAVVDAEHGLLLVSSVADASGSGGRGRSGHIEVAAASIEETLAASRRERVALHERLEDDDHNSAALHVRADGRYVAMYSRHGSDNLTRWRVSRRAGDPTDWGPERTHDNGARTTYSNLYPMPAESRLYAFVRSVGHDPNFLISDDDGMTWRSGGRLVSGPGAPYVRYVADGRDRIHLVATEQHPRKFANGIFHATVERGQLLRSDGSIADDDIFDLEAPAPADLTPVFNSGLGHAWPLDIQLDGSGHPRVVFYVRKGAETSPTDRAFYFARFDGSTWHVHPLAQAGNPFAAAESDYTGLVALDPSRADRVFVSTDIHPTTGRPLVSSTDGERHFELFLGTTDDDGLTWGWTALTANSAEDNLRPIVPHSDTSDAVLLWLRGTYTGYRDYDLAVVGARIS